MNEPRKSTLPLPRRAPRFVSRRTAAALLDLSAGGFDTWVKNGIVPPPAPGSPVHTPRWRWDDIERWLAGDRSSSQRQLFPADAPANPGKKRGRPRKSAPSTGDHHDDRTD